MKFIDAIQKYKKITNDGGKTYYYKGVIGDIYKNAGNSLSYSISANVNFLLSEGWEEYKENRLELPSLAEMNDYYYIICPDGRVTSGNNFNDNIDKNRLSNFNYFTDRDFAQYISDKQLIQRIKIVLTELNKDKFSNSKLKSLIANYLRDNYMNVIDRIAQYESKNMEVK